jgi:hypothetical protein
MRGAFQLWSENDFAGVGNPDRHQVTLVHAFETHLGSFDFVETALDARVHSVFWVLRTDNLVGGKVSERQESRCIGEARP